MNNTLFIMQWLSFFLAMASYLCGSYAIIKGSARPSIITRFFWLLLSVTNLLSYIQIGAGSGVFLALAATLGSCMIFLLSLRFGHIEFKHSDIVAILGACVALFCYLFIPIKLVTLSAGLITHFISGTPTYTKTWRDPYSEDLSFWFLFAVASALSLIGVIIQDKSVIYPLYFLLFDAGMTLLILKQRYRNSASMMA